MSWSSAIKKGAARKDMGNPIPNVFARPTIPQHVVDWARLVSLDFETFFDTDYTLSKLSTSEYIRDPRFKAQMVGIKIGLGKTRIVPAARIKTELGKINWATHSLLCHNTQFDGFILSHHYGIHPVYLYDTLSMARGLHGNDIGAGLDEVSIFYGGRGKLEGLESTKGVLNWDKTLYDATAVYCANDVDEMFRVFKEMLPKMPADEMDLIDLTCRMFCSPVLKVDIPRVEKELERELSKRQALMYAAVDPKRYDIGGDLYDKTLHAKLLKGPAERAMIGVERDLQIIRRIVGSSEMFAGLLRAEGVEPPVKISPAWIKKPKDLRSDEGKWAYAFAKDDNKFLELPNQVDTWGLDANDPEDVKRMVAKQERLQALVDVRIATKSSGNVAKAQRFLTAGADGMALPVGYAYYRAHCLTGDAQVLTRSGWNALKSWAGGDIAQWSPDGSMKFVAASPNSFEVQEPMVHAKGRYHRCVYTKGHTLPTLTSYGTFGPRKAGEALTARFDIPLTGVLDGDASITNLEAQLAVMVQADGNVRSDPARGYCVRFGFAKARKIERCKALLEDAGIKYTEQWEDNVCRIRVGAAHYAQLTKHVGPYKQFDKDFFDAPAGVKMAFISELAHWDGDVEPQPNGFTYTTTDRYNADFVATMAHLSGRAAFVSTKEREGWSDAYRVYIRRAAKTRSLPKDYKEVPFSGRVYCPTTQTGYFLVRQNGCIVVTGNTGRWGGQNKMNMQNLERGGELRLSILAPKGHMLAVCDSGQVEARVNGWLWGQHDLLDAFRAADAGTGRDAYCNFADHIYGREITKADKMERFVGKVCIAEGELVLTPRGLVPIQDISREDRIWDGVEWVTHDGVIDQGIKEVITYDGLTATPDHEVFTEDGRIIPLGQAASEMARLQNTGAERQSLRFCDDHVIADTPRKRLSVRVGSLQLERGQETDLPQQPQKRQDDIVPQKWAQTGAPCCGAGSPVRCDHCEMPQPGEQALEGLWRARDQMLVRVPDGVHSVDHTEPAPQRLHPGGDRPGEQRRELRAKQLEAGDQVPAEPEQAQHPDDSLARPASLDSRVPQPVEPNVHLQVIESGADGRANPREVRTFDIVNAGPRRRYTVSGKLCLNCVLGLGFQMGAPKFQLTLAKGALGGPPVYFELDRCKAIVNTYRLKNWAIVAGWDICKRIIEDMAAGREGSHGPLNWEKETIWLPNGMALKYPGLHKSRNDETGWDEWSYQAKEQRKKIYGGLLCLGAKTQVLTGDGWKSIISVRSGDKLWDGTNWVSHSGLIYQGTKETISFGGVDMTPDHEVLVDDQWIAAEGTTHHEATSSFARHHWAPARNDDCGTTAGQRRAQDFLDGAMRLRPVESSRGLGVRQGQHEKLRMFDSAVPIRVTDFPWHVQTPGLLGVAQHAGSLQTAHSSILEALRRARDRGVRGVERLRSVLGRHGANIQERVGPGPQGQFAGVRPTQLQVGDSPGQHQEHSCASPDRHPGGCYTAMASSGDVGHREHDAAVPQARRVAGGQDVRHARLQEQAVYDLADAGPLKRFTVRGDDGLPFIVHNCENVVQALARIIVGWQMLQISRKYRVVMTTHDEVVAVTKTAQARRCFDFMTKCMTTSPAWCPDLNTASEGGFDVNYSK